MTFNFVFAAGILVFYLDGFIVTPEVWLRFSF